MKKQRDILKVSVALSLLLFSVAVRGHMFMWCGCSENHELYSSIKHLFGDILIQDNVHHADFCYADDTSHDDDVKYLAHTDERGLISLESSISWGFLSDDIFLVFFYSSDTSPPVA